MAKNLNRQFVIQLMLLTYLLLSVLAAHSSQCRCCQVENEQVLKVSLSCEDQAYYTKEIRVPSSCNCLNCESETLSLQKETTAPYSTSTTASTTTETTTTTQAPAYQQVEAIDNDLLNEIFGSGPGGAWDHGEKWPRREWLTQWSLSFWMTDNQLIIVDDDHYSLSVLRISLLGFSLP